MAYLKQIHGSWFAWQQAQERLGARVHLAWTSLKAHVRGREDGPLPGRPQRTDVDVPPELVALFVCLLVLVWPVLAPILGRGRLVAATVGASVRRSGSLPHATTPA